ncbi:MAG: hypothetical protein QG654_308 [Patescibacteria group bacterium]|nr:hypothetical protein [Patescibacteria group bacterium]
MEKFRASSPEKQHNIQEIITHLESRNIKLGLQNKIVTLLTVDGVKPASFIHWMGQGIPESEIAMKTTEEEQEVQNIKEILAGLGLSFDILETVTKVSEHEYCRKTIFPISLDEEKVKDVMEWLKNRYTSDGEHVDHVKIGQLLGFPKTSVEAFNSKQFITGKNLPMEIQNTELGNFILGTSLFAFSKESFQEELEVYKVWMHTIKELSPTLYGEVIKKGQLRMLE